MTQPTNKQIQEAMDEIKQYLSIDLRGGMSMCALCGNKGLTGFMESLAHKDTCPFSVIRAALEQYKPKTVSREDAMNLFPYLCDVYDANGDTGTEFILWLKERGIEVTGQSPDEEDK